MRQKSLASIAVRVVERMHMFANQDLPHVRARASHSAPSLLHVRLIDFDLTSNAGARELYRASLFWFEDSGLQKLLVREMRDSR